MDKFFKIFKVVFYLLILSAVTFLLIVLFPIKGNYQIKIVQSGSMEPSIKTGSIVVIKSRENYAVGDVVTFGKDTKEDIPTTHRIVSSRAIEGVIVFTTKGDANKSSDIKEIREDEIHGKVLFSVPFLGYMIDFARKPIGFVILIVIPAVIVIYDEGIKIYREISRLRINKASAGQEKK